MLFKTLLYSKMVYYSTAKSGTKLRRDCNIHVLVNVLVLKLIITRLFRLIYYRSYSCTLYNSHRLFKTIMNSKFPVPSGNIKACPKKYRTVIFRERTSRAEVLLFSRKLLWTFGLMWRTSVNVQLHCRSNILSCGVVLSFGNQNIVEIVDCKIISSGKDMWNSWSRADR